MAYELHLERIIADKHGQPTPIPLEDWCAAVAETSGVRLYPNERYSFTTNDGAVISYLAKKGDTEVFFADSKQWRSVFRWQDGSVIVAGGFLPGDTSHPVWTAATTLAAQLGAVVRGDEGEVYDLQTGEIVDA